MSWISSMSDKLKHKFDELKDEIDELIVKFDELKDGLDKLKHKFEELEKLKDGFH